IQPIYERMHGRENPLRSTGKRREVAGPSARFSTLALRHIDRRPASTKETTQFCNRRRTLNALTDRRHLPTKAAGRKAGRFLAGPGLSLPQHRTGTFFETKLPVARKPGWHARRRATTVGRGGQLRPSVLDR